MPAKSIYKIFAVILIAISFLFVIFGSILPFMKSNRYPVFMKLSSSARTIEEFESYARNALDFKSPVGQEETVKFILSGIRDIVRSPNLPAPVAEELVHFVELYAFKDDVRHLAAMGDVYSILWAKYGDEKSFATSESYYKKALAIGPNLPPILYSLLTIYQIKEDKEKIGEAAKTILSYWPNDSLVEKLIDSGASGKN